MIFFRMKLRLDVAHNRTFFVGKSGLLVHDMSLPDFRDSPYDAPQELDSGSRQP